MSEWHDIPREDIDIDRDGQEVNLLVTRNDFGNIYATLTFDQIREIHKSLPEPIIKRIECEGVGDNDGFFEVSTEQPTSICPPGKHDWVTGAEVEMPDEARKIVVQGEWCHKCGRIKQEGDS